ncbi:MAG: phage BR0599 family protein [Azoarcus sp.]|jgi:uncharacterized phage protein (TIGR02218 family)|nr:phage BR0599 family protein [Azoarcus sp.]
MSFDSAETSLAQGAPLRLYKFSREQLAWYYTSGDRPVAHLAHTYLPVAGGIADDGIRQTGEASADVLTLTAPASLPVAQLYRATPPANEVTLTVFFRHVNDTGYLVGFIGNVRIVRWKEIDRCEIVASAITNAMLTTGLRCTWGVACYKALYSASCGVEREAWKVPATVASMNGQVINCAEAASETAGHFVGGYVEWTSGNDAIERRSIEAHNGEALTLFGGTYGLSVGASVRLYPGCRQTPAGCKQFGNFMRYGGVPMLPGVSPLDGRNIF